MVPAAVEGMLATGFFIFQFQNRLVFLDLVAFFDKNIDHGAGIRPLHQDWEVLHP